MPLYCSQGDEQVRGLELQVACSAVSISAIASVILATDSKALQPDKELRASAVEIAAQVPTWRRNRLSHRVEVSMSGDLRAVVLESELGAL